MLTAFDVTEQAEEDDQPTGRNLVDRVPDVLEPYPGGSMQGVKGMAGAGKRSPL